MNTRIKKIAVIQSNYVPWKGYFDIISSVDEFVIYDVVQFTKNDWRNRNIIKTPKGIEWLSIPVGRNYKKRICDVRLPINNWQNIHLKTLELNYKKATYYNELINIIEPIYKNNEIKYLSELNIIFLKTLCNYLSINTKITNSSDYMTAGTRVERLVEICCKAGATEYISGPSAKDYINELDFLEKGIKINYFNYQNYPEYPQLWGEFVHNVSILDLLFNCGPESYKFLKNQPPAH
jgi:hypothetical protein